MNWRNKYNIKEKIDGGAQGNCFIVEEINY